MVFLSTTLPGIMMSASTTSNPPPQISEKALKWIESTDKRPTEMAGAKRPDNLSSGYRPTTTRDKMAVIMKNPLVPFGMIATVCALGMGLKANLKGDRFRQQMMMRYRVGFQGFTILMLVGGLAAAQVLIKDEDED